MDRVTIRRKAGGWIKWWVDHMDRCSLLKLLAIWISHITKIRLKRPRQISWRDSKILNPRSWNTSAYLVLSVSLTTKTILSANWRQINTCWTFQYNKAEYQDLYRVCRSVKGHLGQIRTISHHSKYTMRSIRNRSIMTGLKRRLKEIWRNSNRKDRFLEHN